MNVRMVMLDVITAAAFAVQIVIKTLNIKRFQLAQIDIFTFEVLFDTSDFGLITIIRASCYSRLNRFQPNVHELGEFISFFC